MPAFAQTAMVAIVSFLASLALGAGPAEGSAESAEIDLERGLADTVQPFLEGYCVSCHGKEKQRGKLDLSSYSTVDAIIADYLRWETVRKKLEADEMPPEAAKRHPPRDQRRRVIEWIAALRRQGARRNAGDPGPVLARRLSNAEYDYSIRDLTGVDLRPAREFPVDPANEAGFDNSGESLAMSPALLRKHVEAARRVAEHIVFKSKGFVFAPHPVVAETDRDKYCVKRIVDFYERQPTDLAAYFLAAWRLKHRVELGSPGMSLAAADAQGRVSSKYLSMVWSILEATQDEPGPLGRLQARWRELPGPVEKTGPLEGAEGPARQGCERMRDYVLGIRPKLRQEFRNLECPGIAEGSQPFVLWKDRQYAAHRMRGSTSGAAPEGVGEELTIPTDEAARRRHEDALARFSAVFPDAFYVAERGLIFLKEDKESKGRLLSAGFHLMFGYFRDDAPLCALVLDTAAQRELDALWDELRFVASAPLRQYKDFIFFERAEPPRFMQGAEFDFARSEDKDSASEAKIRRLSEEYLAKARRRGGRPPALEAIEDYFSQISAEIRWLEETQAAAEPTHRAAILELAERAYRRPLSAAERDEILEFHRSLCRGGLSHEEAVRDTVASILLSPHFCYRVNLSAAAAGAASSEPAPPATSPLSGYELASRLSYFLWSSLPDRELLAAAAGGRAAAADLQRPEVIAAQARRMLKDDRVRGLATEFGGNWLDFRRFEEHNSVDRERFPSFTNDLRQAMFEEPIRFFVHLVREDRSVLDFLEAGHTFVNPTLALHYGMRELEFQSQEWVRVDDARRYGRGGLLPMSVFLTKNAPGLRTSPVKRGYWVVRRLLGEVIPPPPPQVPELPADEAKLGDLTLRETLARHRQDPSCAGCHTRFDSLGLVFEGYGPIGELRVQDSAGRPVDTRAAFPGGGEGAGVDGLRAYVRERRRDEFLDNLCRKLLSYALGRTLLLSDDPLIDKMRDALAAGGYRFGSLVECIVTSPQFLRRRGPGGLTKG